MKLSVCIDAVFENVAAANAISAVAACGIPAFEFWCWWEKDLDEIRRVRDQHNLQIAACCTKFISLVDASQRDAYLQGLAESIAAARAMDCPTLISQVGDAVPGIGRDQQRQCLIDGLKQAADMLAGSGVDLVIEPLNERVDHPGYYLIHSQEAFEIVDAVDSDSIAVVFDIYHQQISEGDVIVNATKNIDKIRHFHAAGNPGRHELDRGELHYPHILAAIQSTGYEG
ncbi:MAG: TIM barrel protein, partial [Planctomycetota bacterium]